MAAGQRDDHLGATQLALAHGADDAAIRRTAAAAAAAAEKAGVESMVRIFVSWLQGSVTTISGPPSSHWHTGQMMLQ
jgi:hypothetical protein